MHPGRISTYELEIMYPVTGDVLQTNLLSVSEEEYNAPGSLIRIKYLPDNPQKIIRVGQKLDDKEGYYICLGLFLAGGAGTWWWLIRPKAWRVFWPQRSKPFSRGNGPPPLYPGFIRDSSGRTKETVRSRASEPPLTLINVHIVARGWQELQKINRFTTALAVVHVIAVLFWSAGSTVYDWANRQQDTDSLKLLLGVPVVCFPVAGIAWYVRRLSSGRPIHTAFFVIGLLLFMFTLAVLGLAGGITEDWRAGAVLNGTLFLGLSLAACILCLHVRRGAMLHKLTRLTIPELGLKEENILYAPKPPRRWWYSSERPAASLIWTLLALLAYASVYAWGLVLLAFSFGMGRLIFIRFKVGLIIAPKLRWAGQLGLKSRRVRSLSAKTVRSSDPRPPVLLLRSFRDDNQLIDSSNTHWLTFSRLHTLEEHLTDDLWKWGPVVAIGRPGESLPPSGAAREYVEHDHWQNRVDTLLAEALLVVMVAGQTEGLRWEFRRMMDSCRDRLMLVLPNDDPANWQNMWHALDGTELQATLPTRLPRTARVIIWQEEKVVAVLHRDADNNALSGAVSLGARAILHAGK
jgi:hypothetical protein